MIDLDDDQRLVAQTVREFVDREVIPVASEMEHRDEYPDALVETMKALGLFGLNIPERVRRQRGRLHDVRDRLRGAVARLDGAGRNPRLASRPVRRAGAVRHRRSEAAVPAAAGEGRAARRHLSVGAECGNRPSGHHDHGSPRRRHVLHRRLEDVGHQRTPRASCFLLLAKTDPAAEPRPSRHQRVRRSKRARRA